MLVVLPTHVAYDPRYTAVHAGRLADCIAQRPIIGSRLGRSLHQLASADRAPFVSLCACAQVAIMGGSHDLMAFNITPDTYRVLQYVLGGFATSSFQGHEEWILGWGCDVREEKKDLWFSIWWGFVFLFGNLDDTIALRWTARVAHV